MTALQTAVDEHVFLLGRPPIGEFLGFIRSMALDGIAANQGLLTAEWRQANDRVVQLEASEAGLADNPPVEQLPTALQPFAQRVRDNPMFAKTYSLVPTDIMIVQLDRLVVFQKFINLGFVDALKAQLANDSSEEAVARLAFGLDRPVPQVQAMQSAANVFSFVSRSNDFRFLEGGQAYSCRGGDHAGTRRKVPTRARRRHFVLSHRLRHNCHSLPGGSTRRRPHVSQNCGSGFS